MSTGVFILKKKYPGRFTGYLCGPLFMAMLASLVVGNQLGSSGGLITMPHFLNYFKKDTEMSRNHCCDYFFSLFTSSSHLAAIVGFSAASCIYKSQRYAAGLIIVGDVISTLGVYIVAIATKISMLYTGRIMLGLGVNFMVQSVPFYLLEMAPYHYLGGLKFSFQLMITLGIFCNNLLNYSVNKIHNELNWRLSPLVVASIGFVVCSVTGCLIPEPIYLITLGQDEAAKVILRYLRGTNDIDQEFNDLLEVNRIIMERRERWKTVLKEKYRPQFVLALAIPFFQQFTGINVIILYGPNLSEALGFKRNASLVFAVITGCVNIITTIVAAITVAEKIRRKSLFIAGGVVMFLCEIGAAVLININGRDISNFYMYSLLALLCMYFLGFACSWGLLGWFVPSEMFPSEVRLTGYCITVGVGMFLTFVIAQFFLGMFCKFKFGVFYFFAAFVSLMTLFVFYFLPVTKDIPTEEMPNVWGQHWFIHC